MNAKMTFGVFLILLSLVWLGARIWKSEVTFSVECGGHIVNAANANTIDLARQEMEEVVKYINDHRVQPGFTSVVYNTPDEDVGFWVSNMRASLEELKQIKPDATSLEKSNVLIKLRETLTHKASGGAAISVPEGISIYPNNMAFMIWGWFSLVLLVAGVVLFLLGLND